MTDALLEALCLLLSCKAPLNFASDGAYASQLALCHGSSCPECVMKAVLHWAGGKNGSLSCLSGSMSLSHPDARPCSPLFFLPESSNPLCLALTGGQELPVPAVIVSCRCTGTVVLDRLHLEIPQVDKSGTQQKCHCCIHHCLVASSSTCLWAGTGGGRGARGRSGGSFRGGSRSRS